MKSPYLRQHSVGFTHSRKRSVSSGTRWVVNCKVQKCALRNSQSIFYPPGLGSGVLIPVGCGSCRSMPRWREKRYYDFNVRNYSQFVEKLRYIHRNPVVRGLCQRPEHWEWSSSLQWATGGEGCVEIECEWTARKRERAQARLCPAMELPHSSQKKA
jgi:hypothetical protein